MSHNPIGAALPEDVSEPRTPGRKPMWAVVLAAVAGLLMCSCISIATIFLVLTGIIAEPVTVIEEILRVIHALVGG